MTAQTPKTLAEIMSTGNPYDDLDTLSDAHLVRMLEEHLFNGRYLWSPGAGWWAWDGMRWQRTTEAETLSAVSGWCYDRHHQAVDELEAARNDLNAYKAECERDRRKRDHQRADELSKAIAAANKLRKAWAKTLSHNRAESVTRLSAGHVSVADASFDCHPDLLNARNGVVDLRTGDLQDHDPALLMTKVAGVDYRPGATHPDWSTALEAVPAEARDWYQVCTGQGATGHADLDDLLIIQQGGGSNGKSTIATAIATALGDYYVQVAHRAILGDASTHPTELMDLRGARFALMEETPEKGRLDVVRLKQVVGTPKITARHMRKDSVTFDATHTMFISTNYLPAVHESDGGTWRRLAVLPFPYRFRKPGQPMEAENDRPGDPGVRDRLKKAGAAHEAVLAWLVAGAVRWYAAGGSTGPLPEIVVRRTAEWREQADMVCGLYAEVIAPDPDYHVQTRDLFDATNRWLEGRNQAPLSVQTFAARFEGHELSATVTKKRLRRGQAQTKLSESDAYGADQARQAFCYVGVRFRTEFDDDLGEAVQDVQGSPVAHMSSTSPDPFQGRPDHPAHAAPVQGSQPGDQREPQENGRVRRDPDPLALGGMAR